MNHLLDQHPDIFMGKKELHYFGADLKYNQPPRSLDNLLSFYKGSERYRYRGDASVWTLTSTDAAEELKRFDPDARIIILLRNPVDYLRSLHSHLVFRGEEPIEDFMEAMAAPHQRQGEQRPPFIVPVDGLNYRKNIDYPAQLRRFFDAFGRDQVHVVLNDEYRADTEGVYRTACQWLDLPTDFDGWEQVFAPNQRAKNSHRVVRSKWVSRLVVNQTAHGWLEQLDVFTPPGARFALRVMRRLNLRYTDRPKLPTADRQRLLQDFKPMVDETAELLGKDLSAWHPPDR